MTKTALLSIVATVCMGCLLASAWDQSEEKAAGSAPSPFKGRVVVVSPKTNDEIAQMLIDPKIKKLGQVDFLVGVAGDWERPGDWTKNQIIWIPIDDIVQIVEFKNIDEVKKSGVVPDDSAAHFRASPPKS